MTHQKWLEIAERVDSLRVFPRLIIVALFWFMVDVVWFLLVWYTKLPTAAERTAETSGFAAGALLIISGLFKMALTDYLQRGRDWNNQPQVPSTTSTSIVTQQTTGAPPT